MTTRRNWIVYGALLAIWTGLISWQVDEHLRVVKAARGLLEERARYVAMTCGRILRQPGTLVLSKERLEGTISTLVRPGEPTALCAVGGRLATRSEATWGVVSDDA